MDNRPQILICTLSSGENEFAECKDSLKRQTYKNWKHRIFSHLPNKEAHDRLYREFMAQRHQYDLFLKLDADMVFISQDALAKVVNLFLDEPELDHAEIALHDWFSDSLIMGLHAFSNRARWVPDSETLFVDRDPVIPGIKRQYWQNPAPIVSHCPNPADFQSFHFGVHRAFKSIQSNRKDLDWYQSRYQWRLLRNVWYNFLARSDRRLGFACLGADRVFKGEIKSAHYDYTNSELRKTFEKYADISSQDIQRRLSKRWNRSFFLQRVGAKKLAKHPFGYVASLGRSVLNSIKQALLKNRNMDFAPNARSADNATLPKPEKAEKQ